MQWYYKFLNPVAKNIDRGKYTAHPLGGVNKRSLEVSLGFGFERWCRRNAHLFAKILGFSGVDYEAGSFFDRKSDEQEPGFQIDLMYIVRGSKIFICEIKYFDGKMGPEVGAQVKKKIQLFGQRMPKYKNYTFESVLITPEGLEDAKSPSTLHMTFDHVIRACFQSCLT